MSLLTISNLRHTYGTHVVLDGATLSIEAGEKIGLVGRNGSGKTTLMRAIRGDLAPDSGSVQLQKGARVGYLSQHPDHSWYCPRFVLPIKFCPSLEPTAIRDTSEYS